MKLRHVFYSWPLMLLLSLPAVSTAQVTVSVQVAPPELPVYDQPPMPADGYLWTPGYWAWSDDDQDYYWVPGTWIEPPQVGYLWTPGYWGANDAAFMWHPGYWGPQIGFYGGVNYGYGYGGNGYEGGYWQGGHIYYNRAVSNIGTVHVTNVYNKTVINNVSVARVSYSGGNGGIRATPTPAQEAAARGPHIAETPTQRSQDQTARGNPALRVSANHGTPPIAATARPGAFSGAGVVTARHSGTMSVVSPQPHANPESRPAPAHQATPPQQHAPDQRAGAPRAQPHVNPEPRNVPEQRAPEQRAPEQRAPEPRAPEQRAPEQPRQVTQPHPAAPPRPEAHPAAPQRPEPHPPEHPPEH
jgi:WXXGXW repeat (2 copies)